MHIHPRSLQEIRGLAQKWITDGLSGRSLFQVIDFLLPHAAEHSGYIDCEHVKVWHATWKMRAPIRSLDVTENIRWNFSPPLDRLLTMGRDCPEGKLKQILYGRPEMLHWANLVLLFGAPSIPASFPRWMLGSSDYHRRKIAIADFELASSSMQIAV